VTDKVGLVQSAEGGTLFLDEVADLPLHMQVKLLRVIQEKASGRWARRRRFRWTCESPSATHRDLGELVAEGSFREDIFLPDQRDRPPMPPLRDAAMTCCCSRITR
jgi:two-component system response regulator PilR (NtrC family)